MSEYNNKPPESIEDPPKPDALRETIGTERDGVRTDVGGILEMDAHAVAAGEMRRRMVVDEYSEPSLARTIRWRDELLATDPGLLDDADLRADIAVFAAEYLKSDLRGAIAAFRLSEDEVRRHVKLRVFAGILRPIHPQEIAGAREVFPGLPDDPDWHAVARKGIIRELETGNTWPLKRLMEAGLISRGFFNDAVQKGAAICIRNLLHRDSPDRAAEVLELVGDAGECRAALEKTYDESIDDEVRELILEGNEDGAMTEDGKRFRRQPSLVRTDRTVRADYEAWCDRLRPAWVLNRFLEAHSASIPEGGPGLKLSQLNAHERAMPRVALQYARQKMLARFPDAQLGWLGLHVDPRAKTPYYELGGNYVTVPSDEPVMELFESLGEEIGHALRDVMGPEEANNERTTHEFFGLLGRKVLHEQMRNAKTAAFFQKEDGLSRVTGGEDVNFLYPKDLSLRGRNQRTRRRKVWQRSRAAQRSKPEAYDHDQTREPFPSLHRRNRAIAMPERAKDRELLELHDSWLIHQRGYKYADMHFPPDVLARVDVQNIFQLPDREVRRRFFRPDPDFTGLWLEQAPKQDEKPTD